MEKLTLKTPSLIAGRLILLLCFGLLSTNKLLANNDKLVRFKDFQQTVTGTVSDENGTPISGASVVVKGTANGVISDFDGNFSINADANSVLVFSYLGFLTTEVNVGDKSTISVVMQEDISRLDEVVIIGYGTAKRREVTGAISSISSETIAEQTVTGFDQAMAGRIAGVQISQSSGTPGGSTSVRIRGIGTPGNSEPLYVIDGVPVFNNNSGRSFIFRGQATGVLNTLNPNDIESIEVLKDASAGAIYGSRAANGVVLITTKKGKSGDPKFELDYTAGIQSLEKDLDLLDTPTYIEFLTELNGQAPDLVNPANTDFIDEIFDSAPIHDVNFRVSGGTDKLNYLFSLGYLNQEGIMKGSGFDRLSVRLNGSYQVTDRLKLGNNISVSRSVANRNYENAIFDAAIPLAIIYPPYTPAYLEDGSIGGPGDVGGGFIRLSPLVQTTLNTEENDSFRLLGNVFAEYQLLEGLTYRLNLGGDFYYSGSNSFRPFQQSNGAPAQESEATRFDSSEWVWLVEHTLNYNAKIAEDHNLNVLAGFTQQKSTYSSHRTTKTDFVSNETIAIDAGNVISVAEGGLQDWSLMSLIGRLGYSYKDRYFLSGSVRRDGSSRFGPGNKWGVFPSISAGWLVSDEPFFDSSFISQLKIRGSWGQLGNQEIGLFRYLPVLQNNAQYVLGEGAEVVPGYFSARPANTEITWETTTQTDIGIDLGFFNDRLNLSVDYYNKETEDILLDGTVPLAYGFISGFDPRFPTINAGVVNNKGFEFDVAYRDSSGEFQWFVNANLSTVKNEVVSLNTAGPIINSGESLSTRTDVGEPIGSFYGHIVEGIFQNQDEIDALNPDAANGIYYQASGTAPGDFKFKDVNGDGIVDDQDQTYIGSPIPDITYGFSLGGNYKRFDFSMAFQGIAGNDVWTQIFQQAGDFSKPDNKFAALYNERWTGEGTSNTVPRVGPDQNGNYRASTYYVHDGSFLRLKTLQIGYTLPEDVIDKFNLSRARVYIGGQNLLTFDNYDFGLDPEIGAPGGGNTVNGVDRGRYPIARTISVGVNLAF